MTKSSELYEVERKEDVQDDDIGSGVRFIREADNYGFASISHHILEDSTLSDAAKVTYGVLLKYAMQKGIAWPSIREIARTRGRSEKQIGEHLKELVDRGLISREPQTRKNGSKGITITYILDIEPVYCATNESVVGHPRERGHLNKNNKNKNNPNTKNTLIIATPSKSDGVVQSPTHPVQAVEIPIQETMTIEKGKPTSQPETTIAPASVPREQTIYNRFPEVVKVLSAKDTTIVVEGTPETAFTILADAYTPPGKPRRFIALTQSQKNYIESYVVPSRLELWRSTCEAWALSGFKPTNIRGLVDWFVNGVPNARTNGGYGSGYSRTRQGSSSSPLRDVRGVDD